MTLLWIDTDTCEHEADGESCPKCRDINGAVFTDGERELPSSEERGSAVNKPLCVPTCTFPECRGLHLRYECERCGRSCEETFSVRFGDEDVSCCDDCAFGGRR
jgi:hypothetical protein